MGVLAIVASLSAGGLKPAPPYVVGGAGFSRPQQAQEVLAEIRVHGNHVSSDEEILKIAGLKIGEPITATTVTDVRNRLRAANRFDDIDVLKRFASISDPTRIVIVIIVNEGPVRIELPPVNLPDEPVRVTRRRGLRNLMFMPILDGEDGYGFTYGARVAHVGLVGERSRVSFPLTWGGLKRAGAEFEHSFRSGPLTRVEVGGALQRRRNPAFEENDDRKRVWGRAERAFGDVRLGATGAFQRVTFAGTTDDLRSFGADVAFDTRLDPVLPRNAVFAQASWERVNFASGGATNRTRYDARGYLGVFRQVVFVARVVREDADRPLPPYLRSLLGGWSSLRGFKAGSFHGDTLVTGSAEIRWPISSPLSVGKLGLSVFADTGTVYDKGQRFRDQTLRTGIGGSVWLTLAAFRMSLAVAHGRGADTRVNFGGGLTF
jgi:outer membrane protein assembly factor BamA